MSPGMPLCACRTLDRAADVVLLHSLHASFCWHQDLCTASDSVVLEGM